VSGGSPPGRPQAPSVAMRADGHVLLQWARVFGATAYMVRCVQVAESMAGNQLGEAKECTGTLGSEVGGDEPFVLPSTVLEPGSGYRFEVLALNKAGESEPSATSDFVEAVDVDLVLATAPPSKVEGLHATYTLDGVELSWNGLEEATSYKVVYRPHGQPEWVTADAGDAVQETQFSVDGLMEMQEYEFAVVATNGIGEGARSDFASMFFGAQVPEAPEPPEASEVTARSAQLSWAEGLEDGGMPVTGFKLGIRVEGTDYSGDGEPVGNRDGMLLENLMPGTRYRFRVASRNQVGWSAYSQESAVILTLKDFERKMEIWRTVGFCIVGAVLLCCLGFALASRVKDPSSQYMELKSMDTLGHGELGDSDDEGVSKVDTAFDDDDESFEELDHAIEAESARLGRSRGRSAVEAEYTQY